MNDTPAEPTVFLVLVRTERERDCAYLLVESIRSFGGRLSRAPIRVFESRPDRAPCADLEADGVQVIPLTVRESVRHYEYGDKVYSCMRAEEAVRGSVASLVFLTPECLIVNPPALFDLGRSYDAAVRPVHIRNVGLHIKDALDGFWRGVYGAVGVDDVQTSVVSFVDAQHLRAYFNSAAFAVRPSLGVFRRWFECFESLVCNEDFQAGHCRDERHRIFLHQAVLSTLISTSLNARRVRVLPDTYGYPYNLHQDLPPERRTGALNDAVCAIYHHRSIDPRLVDDIEIREPLAAWLISHIDPNR
jgi:hypothetical protein